ncbi:MAG: YihY/virulence factor BrkB family protein [Acidimicrobiales bacterium]
MAKSNGRKNGKGGTGAVETVLAPVASLVVVASAALRGRHADESPPERAPDPERPEPASARDDDPPPSKLKAKLEELGRRFKPLGIALAMQQRYSEVRGNNVAAAVTLQAFLSLFPLMLVIVAVVGFVSNGGADVASSVISALGLTGEAAHAVQEAVMTAERSRKAASVVGLAGLLWSGLGLVNALQYALNQVWQVEERGVKDKAIGLGWLVGSALLLVAGAATTTVLGWLPGVLSPVAVVMALFINLGLWLWTFKALPNRDIPMRELVPGAVLGAVGLEVLKVVGGYYVPRAVSSSSELYGSLGVVFAILAWLLLFGRLIVYAASLNVVFWERHHGTMKAEIEIPAAPGATPEDVTRSGRLEKEDLPPEEGGEVPSRR